MIYDDVMNGRNLIRILLDPPLNHLALETTSSRSLSPPSEALKSDDDFDSLCKVYKTESVGESTGKVAVDVSTQTDDKRHQRRRARREMSRSRSKSTKGDSDSGLSRDEISHPPSDLKP
ncbi:hypothetical protein ACFX2K_002404 [Malus domestica]